MKFGGKNIKNAPNHEVVELNFDGFVQPLRGWASKIVLFPPNEIRGYSN